MSPFDTVVWSSESGEWGTPPDLFERLNHKYGFTLDPAASDTNHLCEKYYTIETDGLAHSWDDNRVFLNPPYGRGIAAWVQKAAKSEGLVVALLPVRTGSRWWWEWVAPYADVEFLKGRLKFVGAENSAPFDSAIARYR